MSTDRHQLGDLQLAIMRVLWDLGEATVTDVHTALFDDRGLAPTTVATMLTKMEKKGVVTHRTQGRKFVYRATVTEETITQSMVGRLAERLFAGDVTAMVSHLITEHEIDSDELQDLRSLIADREAGGS